MEVEVLLSCMNQTEISIVETSNIKTKAIIINQCGENNYSKLVFKKNILKFISSEKKGLTNSRNLALIYSTGDICIICDDDVRYKDDYKEKITEAFSKLSDADIVIFDINRLNLKDNIPTMSKIKVAPKFKSYGSVRIAFKRKSIQENNIWFDKNFGTGSIFSSGEETIFLNEARKKGLKIYEYPEIIADVDFAESTWRTGYDEKLFYDKGALLAAAYPNFKYIFMLYYLIRFRKLTLLSGTKVLTWLYRGSKGYKKLYSYDEYNGLKKKSQI